jgi:hypothetical protein
MALVKAIPSISDRQRCLLLIIEYIYFTLITIHGMEMDTRFEFESRNQLLIFG